MTAEVYVLVSRVLHAHPDWDGPLAWHPIAHMASIEEAWAALDLAKERERAKLTDPTKPHPHELEYDVWTVPAWDDV